MTLTLENSVTSAATIFAPLVTRAEDGPWVDLGDHRGRVLVSSRNNAEAFALAHTVADFNGGVPPHIHDREDETFYIMKGCVEFGVGGETIVANAGDTVFAPRGVAHTWRCASEEGAEFLILFTPGDNFESFILEVAQQGIMPSDLDSIEKLVAISESYGIHMLPPV